MVKIQLPGLKAALTLEVLKREVVEDDQAEDARKKV